MLVQNISRGHEILKTFCNLIKNTGDVGDSDCSDESSDSGKSADSGETGDFSENGNSE